MNDLVPFLLTKEGRRAVEVFTRNVTPQCRTVTRGSVHQATVGCRWWQIVYAILVSLPYPLSTLLVWSKGVNKSSEWKTYQEMMEVTRTVIQQLETYRWSSLYSILYRNRVVECPDEVPPEEPCLRRMNASFVDSAPDGRYYTCLYTGDTIGHYFVIERQYPSWYLSSSYGSEWVRVPVQTQEVPEDELREWLTVMDHMGEESDKKGESEEDQRILEQFYIRYFLKGGLPMRYSENAANKLQGRPIPLEVGIAKELEIALHGPLRIGYIESMEEYILSIVKNTVGNVSRGGRALTRGGQVLTRGGRALTRRRGWKCRERRKSAKRKRHHRSIKSRSGRSGRSRRSRSGRSGRRRRSRRGH